MSPEKLGALRPEESAHLPPPRVSRGTSLAGPFPVPGQGTLSGSGTHCVPVNTRVVTASLVLHLHCPVDDHESLRCGQPVSVAS